ncbi:hypothetical protein GGTG_07009 [Gaeumannomyces tritici R3-111a-1]|uniref:Uncharacterized protein n=1 Tax=Gaeumannomyces tritici (strain R3-111a-1) TaxID=644352 RepID=J3P0G3_GAET3|nr:hypothetical protein GGTG_07009 [Gaeumannomyces tritici R3-111a-1]EJT77096.1 hypothetical protein GGTG_07009 [Gaeumannomyces tritici R3-111a-1]
MLQSRVWCPQRAGAVGRVEGEEAGRHVGVADARGEEVAHAPLPDELGVEPGREREGLGRGPGRQGLERGAELEGSLEAEHVHRELVAAEVREARGDEGAEGFARRVRPARLGLLLAERPRARGHRAPQPVQPPVRRPLGAEVVPPVGGGANDEPGDVALPADGLCAARRDPGGREELVELTRRLPPVLGGRRREHPGVGGRVEELGDAAYPAELDRERPRSPERLSRVEGRCILGSLGEGHGRVQVGGRHAEDARGDWGHGFRCYCRGRRGRVPLTLDVLEHQDVALRQRAVDGLEK